VPGVTLVDASVKTPVFEIVASPDMVPKIGSLSVTPRRICPSIPGVSTVTGPVPEPTSIP